MGLIQQAKVAAEERQVYVGGIIVTFAIAAMLFQRDAWKGGMFISLWAPPIFRLADLISERIEEQRSGLTRR